MSLHFEITTPLRTLVKADVDSVTLPTRRGEITVLPNHIPLVAILAPGELVLRTGGVESYVAVGSGYVEVLPGSRLQILADTAEHAEELDMQAIEEAQARARRLMEEGIRGDDVAFAGAAAALERELVRLKVARRRAPRRSPTMHEK